MIEFIFSSFCYVGSLMMVVSVADRHVGNRLTVPCLPRNLSDLLKSMSATQCLNICDVHHSAKL